MCVWCVVGGGGGGGGGEESLNEGQTNNLAKFFRQSQTAVYN